MSRYDRTSIAIGLLPVLALLGLIVFGRYEFSSGQHECYSVQSLTGLGLTISPEIPGGLIIRRWPANQTESCLVGYSEN